MSFRGTLAFTLWMTAAILIPVADCIAAPLQVVNRFLQDARHGNAMIRGVNIPVYKSGYADDLDAVAAAVATTKANAVRLEWWASPDPTTTQYTTANLDRAIAKFAGLGILPIVELHDLTFEYGDDLPGGRSNDPAVFAATITAFWTRADVLAVLIKHQDHLVINIANEWGSSTYRDGSSTAANFIQNYAAAFTAMRNAGIAAPLMVDAPKGFEYPFILANGQAILNADPQHNVLLSVHAYWEAAGYSDADVNAIIDSFASSGLPIVLGEASSKAYSAIPCDPIHYPNLLTRANANLVGYLIWAWYENGLPCVNAMNITVNGDGVTVPTAANPGFGYDVLEGAGYGINTALPPTTSILATTKVLTPGRAIASWPPGVPAGERRPVLVFLPGWGGSGAVDASISSQNTNLMNQGYVTLAIGFDSAQPWVSDIAQKALEGLDKLCADPAIPANCGAVALMGESYGSAQNYWVIEYLRSNGYAGGAGAKGRALAFLSEDGGYGAPGTLDDEATGAFTRTGLANTAAYSVAMIENLGDTTFPVDACTWGNCGARVLSEAHAARGDANVFSLCPAGGEHATRGFAGWDEWVVSAVKQMIHGTQGIATFTGYSGPTATVANACVLAGPTPPQCTLAAVPATIAGGGSSTLTATCNPAAASYAWTGGTCAGLTGATCIASPTTTTSYSVVGSNAAGAGNVAAATVTVTASGARLANLSTRVQVLQGDDVMIGGFVISGAAPKTVVVRAIGPSLAGYGVAGSLPNPQLRLVRSSDHAVIAANDDWATDQNAGLLASSGLAPSNTLESALYVSLAPGVYTAIVSGVLGATGVGLVEIYEVDHPEVALINISTRGKVSQGFDVMIGGFVILGEGSQTVVVRAIGPSLASYGVSGTLANPKLQLVRMSDNTTLANNDDWGNATNANDIANSGFAPSNALESAILVTLQPGAYTAIVSGVNEGTGVGLIEVYKVGP
jgi:hypothetical protein